MYKEKIIAAGLQGGSSIRGISADEIREIELAQQVAVPQAYRAFLAECGKSAGSLCCDAYFFYPALKYLKQDVKEMLGDDDEDMKGFEFSLPENALVIGSYQGRQHDYLICDGTDDPAVFRLTLMKGASRIHESFTSYIDQMIDSYRAMNRSQ